MKNLLLFCVAFFLTNSLLFAQAPQGLNYQAVAYDGGGLPVANQSISVRLSILDGSATGTTVYEETQNPTTDNTGLFSIVIGNGTIVSGAFNTINWGNGSKWLKSEIDITGGTNYVAVGTTQFMSVPYALYANTSGFASGSFSNPDGFEHALPVILPNNVNYTVPAGKNLYIQSGSSHVIINGDTLRNGLGIGGADSKTFLGASENSIVSSVNGSLVGFIVEKKVDWKTIDLRNISFTVPANKQLVIVSSMTSPYGAIIPSCQVVVNGTQLSWLTSLTNMLLDAGDVIATTGCGVTNPDAKYILNGYLKDK